MDGRKVLERTNVFTMVIHEAPEGADGPGESMVLRFLTEYATKEEAEQAARRAVAAYLRTEEGREELKDICPGADTFNWGDAAVCVPNSFYAEEGLTPSALWEGREFCATVDHDENLAAGMPGASQEGQNGKENA